MGEEIRETTAERERAVDAWLRGPVADAYDAIDRGDAELMTVEDVRASLDRDV